MKAWMHEMLEKEQRLRIAAARLQARSEETGVTGADVEFEGLRDCAYTEACGIPLPDPGPGLRSEIENLLERKVIGFREAAAIAEGGFGYHWIPGADVMANLTREAVLSRPDGFKEWGT